MFRFRGFAIPTFVDLPLERNFIGWLCIQEVRDDHVGLLAREVFAAGSGVSCCRRHASSWESLRAHIASDHHAVHVLPTFDAALEEFRGRCGGSIDQFLPEPGQYIMALRCPRCAAPPRVNCAWGGSSIHAHQPHALYRLGDGQHAPRMDKGLNRYDRDLARAAQMWP